MMSLKAYLTVRILPTGLEHYEMASEILMGQI